MSEVVRSPTPVCPSLGRAAGARYPLVVGAVGVGLGTRRQTPLCALLRAGFVRRGGGTRVPGGGRLLPQWGASEVGRSPTPHRPSLGRAAGACYRLAVGAGGEGWDPSPTPLRALLRGGFARRGGSTKAPGEGNGLPGCGGSKVGRSPTPDRPFLGRAARARYPLAVGAGGVGLGTCHQPHCARSLELALRTVGAAPRRPRGGAPLDWVWGVRGRALCHALPPVLGACSRGPLPTGFGCGGCGCGDPSPTPQRALLPAGFASCGGGTRSPGGGRLLPGHGAFRVERSPSPYRPSLERAAGARYPLAVGAGAVGVWTCNQPHSARSCELALRAVGAARGRPGGGGGVGCLGVGRPGLGALPRPTARPWDVRPGPATHWLWAAGGWAWRPVTNPTARAFAGWLGAL